MWYFLIKQGNIERKQLQAIQKQVSLTEIELFNEPYENWYVFSVEKDAYATFINYLDRESIVYELASDRPTRAEMIAGMNKVQVNPALLIRSRKP